MALPVPEYVCIAHPDNKNDVVIKVLKGEFKDYAFQFKKVEFNEAADGTTLVNIDYDLIYSPSESPMLDRFRKFAVIPIFEDNIQAAREVEESSDGEEDDG